MRRALYVLLFLWAAISMAYYIAGVAALNEKWFHGDRHANPPFDVHDDLTLHGLTREAKAAGLTEGDVIRTVEGRPFTGDAQATQYLRHARPGDVMKGEYRFHPP